MLADLVDLLIYYSAMDRHHVHPLLFERNIGRYLLLNPIDVINSFYTIWNILWVSGISCTSFGWWEGGLWGVNQSLPRLHSSTVTQRKMSRPHPRAPNQLQVDTLPRRIATSKLVCWCSMKLCLHRVVTPFFTRSHCEYVQGMWGWEWALYLWLLQMKLYGPLFKNRHSRPFLQFVRMESLVVRLVVFNCFFWKMA